MTTSNDKKPAKNENASKDKKKQSGMQHNKKPEATDRKHPEKTMQNSKAATPQKEQDFDEADYAEYTE